MSSEAQEFSQKSKLRKEEEETSSEIMCVIEICTHSFVRGVLGSLSVKYVKSMIMIMIMSSCF